MENSIKITKSDGSYVLFDNLTVRQLELLRTVRLMFELSQDKKLSDEKLGNIVRSTIKIIE